MEEYKEPETYYYIGDMGHAQSTKAYSRELSLRLRKMIGNYFKTDMEVEQHINYLLAKEIIKQDTKGFKPDWNNPSQKKIFGYYNIVDKKLCHFNAGENIESKLYFKTEEDIEESFKKHPNEWRTYLTYEQ